MTSPAEVGPTNPLAGTTPAIIEPIAVDDVNMDWDTELDGDSAMNFWNFAARNPTESGLSSLSSIDLLWKQYQDASGHFQDSRGSNGIGIDYEPGDANAINFHGEPLSPKPATGLGSEPTSVALFAGNTTNQRNDSLGNETYVTAQSHVPSRSQAPGPSISDRPLGYQSEPSTALTPASSGAHNTPNKPLSTSFSASNHSFKANRPAVSSPSGPSVRSVAVQNTGLFGVDDITNIICDYPRHMLRPNFWSPFVHHRHYRCSQGGLAEPIAIALCCVSASLQSVESSLPFVHKMINNERDNLVHDFPTKSKNLEDAIAVLHAMCIYQIEAILTFRSQKAVKQRVSSTELYHHFLLKMTRRLCQEHIEKVSSKDNTNISWHCWTMAETLRRTTFLVDMVNELSYRTDALNHVYFESLHETLLLEMPLPAPDSMWRALNEDDWATARDATGWTGAGIMTLSTAIDRLKTAPGDATGSSESEDWRSDNIQQISKLIISSARHLRR